jgi:flavin reductase (DIM6/NTAB) family NADH-FMN oxidoreductase RutF
MQFDMRALDKSRRYKILGACVTPRPIAWISSQSAEGMINVSPFSFFTALGDDPPTIVVGMVAHPERRLKDTPSNIRELGEFVVNLVGEHDAAAMNLTSIDAPSGVNEAELAGLVMVPSLGVAPPRIGSAPVSFECRVLHWIETGPHQVAIIAEIIHAHVRDEFLLDPDRLTIDVPAMKLIARLHGAGWYARQTDMFEMLRPRWTSDLLESGGPHIGSGQPKSSSSV